MATYLKIFIKANVHPLRNVYTFWKKVFIKMFMLFKKRPHFLENCARMKGCVQILKNKVHVI